LTKVFIGLLVVNVAFLSLYLLLSYFEWNGLLGLPLVAAINCSPLRTQIWFGGTIPVIIDGHLWIDHWSLTAVLAIVFVNLAAVWRIQLAS